MALSSDERAELAQAAGRFLDRSSGPEQVRAVVDHPDQSGHSDDDMWKQIVEMGWTGIHVPHELGGADAGYDGLGVILHEMGRHLATSPFVSSAVLATEAFLHAPNRDLAGELVPRLVAGEMRATVATDTAMRWERHQGGVRVTGRSRFVLDAPGADVVVIAAESEQDGPVVVAVDNRHEQLTCTPIPTLDRTRRLFEIKLDDVAVPAQRMLAEPGAPSRSLIERIQAIGAIAVASDGAGVAARVTELTADYAKNRVQFGKPIGTFQAVKHHCADMVIAVEASRAAVRAAFAALDQTDGDVSLAADVVSSYGGPACSRVCALAIQVHGGIGFTWEHDAHLYLKRAKLDEMMFGTPIWHRRRLAAQVFPRISPAWVNHFEAR